MYKRSIYNLHQMLVTEFKKMFEGIMKIIKICVK
jgi:hypothetical protein